MLHSRTKKKSYGYETSDETELSFASGSDEDVPMKAKHVPLRSRSTRVRRKPRFLGEGSDDDDDLENDDENEFVDENDDFFDVEYEAGKEFSADRPKRQKATKIQSSYCELSDHDENNSVDTNPNSRRNPRTLKRKKYSDDESYKTDDDDDDVGFANRKQLKAKSANKKISDSDESDFDDAKANVKPKAIKQVIRKPWESDEDDLDDDEFSDDDDDQSDSDTKHKYLKGNNRDMKIYIDGDEAIVELNQSEDSIDFSKNIMPPKVGLSQLTEAIL